jgi:hypothetical protein
MGYVWGSLIFSLGFAIGCWWASRPDEECHACKASYDNVISDLRTEIHGLKSTKGALAKELQNMAFRNAGYKAR